jgi:DNA-binding NarL/FixJ family response regulator
VKLKAPMIGDLDAMVRMIRPLESRVQTSQDKRKLVVDFCKFIGKRVGAYCSKPSMSNGLSPRMRQTLELLLAGDSEKQVAHKLKLSQHTVHVYAKSLYKHFGVSSRGELLARCLGAPAGE